MAIATTEPPRPGRPRGENPVGALEEHGHQGGADQALNGASKAAPNGAPQDSASQDSAAQSSASPVLPRHAGLQAAGPTLPLRISVVIPHLNQPEMLAACLASLARGRRAPDQVIVVDNGSAQLPEAVCAAYPGTQLLQELTPGPGPARNRGIAAAQGEILAFIDADCRAHPDWLAAAEAALADPTAQILGGDVRIWREDRSQITALEAYESLYAYRMDRYIAREGFTGTGNLVVRRPVLDSVGPFAGIGVAEDRDWGQRATAGGHRIRYVAGMKVYHPARRSFAELRQKWDRHMAHDFARARGQRFGRAKWALKTAAMGLSPLAEIPRLMLSDRIEGGRARLLAFATLARIRGYRALRMVWLLAGGDAEALAARWNRPNQAPKG